MNLRDWALTLKPEWRKKALEVSIHNIETGKCHGTCHINIKSIVLFDTRDRVSNHYHGCFVRILEFEFECSLLKEDAVYFRGKDRVPHEYIPYLSWIRMEHVNEIKLPAFQLQPELTDLIIEEDRQPEYVEQLEKEKMEKEEYEAIDDDDKAIDFYNRYSFWPGTHGHNLNISSIM